MNTQIPKPRYRRRFSLLVVGVVGVLAVCVGGLWLAYALAKKRLAAACPIVLVYEGQGVPIAKGSSAMDACMAVLDKRLRAVTKGFTLARVGDWRLSVRLPAVSDAELERLRAVIERRGQLSFHLVSDNQSDCAKASAGNMVPNYTPFVAFQQKEPKSDRIVRRFRKADFRDLPALKLRPSDWMGLGGDAAVLVKDTPEITGDLLDTGSVHVTRDARGGVAIGFAFQGKGRTEFTYITERNKGRQLAVILDEILYSAPVIQSRISGLGIIENPQGFDPDEARDLSITLQSGSLPLALKLVELSRGGVGTQEGAGSGTPAAK